MKRIFLLAVVAFAFQLMSVDHARAENASEVVADDPLPNLSDPLDPLMNRQAPAEFSVRFTTTAGAFVVKVQRELAPLGADRFFNLVEAGYYDDQRIFRVVPGFVAQFGMHGKPMLARIWKNARIDDDPVKKSNTRGTLTFATAGPDTRTTQLFINLADNQRLDRMGFAPFGDVVEGMNTVEALYAGYGEDPKQPAIEQKGNQYLDMNFPKLTQIQSAVVVAE